MPHDFSDWWKCLKKHYKRTNCWLPRAHEIADAIRPRPLRYFTLCALPMIDVFMLARENLLDHGEEFKISGVVFCESDVKLATQITDILGVEGSGFPNELESLVLFEDNHSTEQYQDLDSIKARLEDQGLPNDERTHLLLKEQHIALSKQFPFDFLNLDFCNYYYEPPDILKINKTVERIIEWQGQLGENADGESLTINKFVVSITCKHDVRFPEQAYLRLEEIITQNSADYPRYAERVEESDRPTESQAWRVADPFDFVLSSWPKEILAIAKERGWRMQINHYVYYDRPKSPKKPPYKIICLVATLTREEAGNAYLEQSLRALDQDTRVFIDEIDRDSPQGAELLADLRAIVDTRNERARTASGPKLDDPGLP